MAILGILVGPGRRAFDIEVAREVFDDRSDRGVPKADVRIIADHEVTELDRYTSIRRSHAMTTVAELDLLIVPGTETPLACPALSEIEAVANARKSGVTIASLCTGAFTLARAGVLAGHTATTHWRFVDELAAQFPEIDVRPRDLYCGDGKVWTSAGVTAGIDLLLHLLRQQWGATAAETVARSMVTPAFRPGTQAQFAVPRMPRSTAPTLEQLHRAVTEDLSRQWQTRNFAQICSMSPRTFYRWFAEQLRTTPNAWLNDLRIAEAQRLLEAGSLSVSAVAHAVGYGSDDLLRKHFSARLGTTPTAHSRVFTPKAGRSPATPDLHR